MSGLSLDLKVRLSKIKTSDLWKHFYNPLRPQKSLPWVLTYTVRPHQ